MLKDTLKAGVEGLRSEHFNKLTPSEAERLVIMAEECAEVIQVIGKIQRHGYESYNPTLPPSERETNRQALAREIGHFEMILCEMYNLRDVDPIAINDSARKKRATIGRWLHHNDIKP